MDRRQRYNDSVEQFRSAFEGMQAGLWTALPGVINSVDLGKQTCTVQPTVMAQVTAQDGSTSWVELPLLLDVPIYFPTGGGFTLTFPVTAGDECLVVFASRAIDNWWAQSGDVGPSGHGRSQAELRMHDLSDGFAFVGFRNTSRLVSDINASAVELRTDAGTAVVSILNNSDVYVHSDAKVRLDATSDVTVNSAANVTVTCTGNLQASAQGNAQVEATGTLYLTGGVAITASAPIVSFTAPTINLVGAVSISGSLMLNGKDIDTHEHAPGTYMAGSTHVTGTSGNMV